VIVDGVLASRVINGMRPLAWIPAWRGDDKYFQSRLPREGGAPTSRDPDRLLPIWPAATCLDPRLARGRRAGGSRSLFLGRLPRVGEDPDRGLWPLFSSVWIPACAGTTALLAWIPACAGTTALLAWIPAWRGDDCITGLDPRLRGDDERGSRSLFLGRHPRAHGDPEWPAATF
jgi:hypothetical protein